MKKISKKALVICGHGSSSSNYFKHFKKIEKKINKEVTKDCFSCFIEKNKPSVDSCFRFILEKNYKEIIFFPFLLFSGNHLKIDFQKKIKNLSKSRKEKITIISQFSLIDEILPVMKKKIKELTKKNKKNILVTFSSFSSNRNVRKLCKNYTNKLADCLEFQNSYSFFVGEEKKILDIEHKNNNFFLVVHPIFLFQGFLQKKNLDGLKNLDLKKTLIVETLMSIDEIQYLLIKKLKGLFNTTY